ncbi:MAG: hemerythrin domain-containing protein [Alphaproteobacteria bacterium]
MKSAAITIIQREHRAIAAVVHCLEHVLDEIKAKTLVPEYDLFASVIDYIENFSDRFHHPKENDYLFKAVVARDPSIAPVIADLKTQHDLGERKIADLRWKLEAFRESPKDKFAAFDAAAREYIDFQRRHIGLEEQKVIPLADRVLTADDWRPIEAAFSDNEDPIFGNRPRAHFDKLFSRIVMLAPQPHGLAERHAPKPAAETVEPKDYRAQIVNLHWI